MKNLEKLQKKAFKTNNPDFLRAVGNRNFDEMADCYNELMRYDDFGVPNDGNKYFFAEVLDGYVMQFPSFAKAKVRKIGKHFYYGLSKTYVSYTRNEFPDEDEKTDLVYAFFKDDFIECEKVVLTDSIRFTKKAVNMLRLSVGDILKICFEEDTILIDKFE